MDATQVLDDFDEEEANNSGAKKTVAFLKVLAIGEFPETIFPVYEGENIIGRHDSCDITIPLQAVSKKHACIDVHGNNHLICDYNSRNKTRRNQMFLKPQAFYELVNEIELMFADIKCQYLLAQAEEVSEKDDDSGSETASESMIPPSVDEDELEQDIKDKEQQEELGEKYLEEATQDYNYENPAGENSPVFCPETDDETDDEKEGETDRAVNKTAASSLSTEQTGQYSPSIDATVPCNTLINTLQPDMVPETPYPQRDAFEPPYKLKRSVDVKVDTSRQNSPSIDATIPCDTLINSLQPDAVPETPYPQTDDYEPPYKLKRSVDIKVDTSRRISAGNTLAYGLSTLESPNSTRESMDVSESEKTKEEASSEDCTPEPKNKLHFEDATETPMNNNGKDGKQDSVPKPDEFLDDLLATQRYEPMEIPESPEYLKEIASDNEFGKEGEKAENGGEKPEGETPEGEKPEGETFNDKTCDEETFGGERPEVESCKDETSESEMSDGKILDSKILETTGETTVDQSNPGNSSEGPKAEGQSAEVEIPVDDMMETQAYELEGLSPQIEYEEMATQSYSLACDRNSEDELAATQAYGLFCDVDLASTEDELSATQAYGVKNNVVVPKLSNVFKVPGAMNTQELNEDVLGDIREQDESADENEKISKEEYDDEMDIQPTQKYFNNQVKESGETSESSDDLPSLSNIMGLKSDSDNDFMFTSNSSRKKSSTPINVQKSAAVVIEGQNAISTKKPCYIECPGEERAQDKALDAESISGRKTSSRGRKKSTSHQGKIEEPYPAMEDNQELSNTPEKDDLAVRSTQETNVIAEDSNNQQEVIVVKRGKGRSTGGKRSAARTRSSRGKKEEVLDGGTDGDIQEDEGDRRLSKGRKNTRKRKISEKYTETRENNERKNIQSEQEAMNVSDGEDNRDVFKLQISAIDSPDTDDFIPCRKESAMEPKTTTTQRGKKAVKEDEGRNDESESADVMTEKLLESNEAVSTSTKSTRKGREKKNKIESDGVTNEEKMNKSDKDEPRPSQSTRKGRARKSQAARVAEDSEDINEEKNQANQRKNSAAKSSKAKKDVQKVAENVVKDVVTLEETNNSGEQENKESQPKTATVKSTRTKKAGRKVIEMGDCSQEVNQGNEQKNSAVRSTKTKKAGPKAASNVVECEDEVDEINDSSQEGNQQKYSTVKFTKANKARPKETANVVADDDKIDQNDISSRKGNQQQNSAAKSTKGKKGGRKVIEMDDSSEDVPVNQGNQQKNSTVKSTKVKKCGLKKVANIVEGVDNVEETCDTSEDVNKGNKPKNSAGKSTKAKKGGQELIQNIVNDAEKGTNLKETNANKTNANKSDKDNTESEQKDAMLKSENQEFADAMTPVVHTRINRSGRKGKQAATKTSRNDSNDDQVEQAQNETSETKVEQPKTQGRARKRKSSENLNQNETQQRKSTPKKRRKNTTTKEVKTETEEQLGRETTASSHGGKFESEELELTPKTLQRRSSSKASTPSSSKALTPSSSKASTPSSSGSKVSRSGRKGKKQELEDGEGSAGLSSNVKVIFTGLQDAILMKAKKIVQLLGGKAVEHVEECTHLVTDKVRRTVKFLCALSRGVPIVDMSWLDASKKSKSFVDSTKFILQDNDAQTKYDFKMERSLELAKNTGLLHGYKIHVTPHVRPPPQDMKEIIKCAKGEIVSKMPSSGKDDLIVMSCDEDKEMCKKAHIQTAYTAELLLTGILRQELDLEQHKLTLEATPGANSTPAKNKGRRKR